MRIRERSNGKDGNDTDVGNVGVKGKGEEERPLKKGEKINEIYVEKGVKG